MRRSRRGGHSGLEFGGSGEDSFVAVVVTKLTGALLFILLLTMVIMALIPKAVDLPSNAQGDPKPMRPPLAITTPAVLPEAIAGRPYALALAATGGEGSFSWAIDGPLPEGLSLDPATGQLRGTPRKGTLKPAELTLRVRSGEDRASTPARLVVYQSDRPLTTPSSWKPGIPPLPWREWLDHGFGFLVLGLVHLVGMNSLSNLQRWSTSSEPAPDVEDEQARALRFRVYRAVVRLASIAAAVGLAAWLRQHPTG